MHRHGYIGRKIRQPQMHEKPAIIIIAFGSTSRGKAAMSLFEKKVAEKYAGFQLYWAYSSAIIRRKTGLLSLHQALAQAESDGFRKVVVQPLHVFPGTEYQQLAETCEYFPGLRVFLGETLMHRWDFIESTLEIVEQEFLSVEQGLNLIALHGTPLVADPVNVAYLGVERLLSGRYENVVMASVEGIPDFESLKRRLAHEQFNKRYTRIKIIPLMFLAGVHVEEDLMGNEESWRIGLESLGFSVTCSSVCYDGAVYFKGLGFYPEIMELYLERLQRAVELSACY